MNKYLVKDNKIQNPVIPRYTYNITYNTEIELPTKVDGKTEYLYRVNIGALPNKTNKSIPFVITNKTITRMLSGSAMSNQNEVITIPQPDHLGLYLSGGNLILTATTDRSRFSGFVDIYYTKN